MNEKETETEKEQAKSEYIPIRHKILVVDDEDANLRLLRRVLGILDALLAHANRGFEKIVHLVLAAEIPGVALVPREHDELAAVKEAGSAEFRRGIGLVPDHELERVEHGIEHAMPVAELVVAREGDDIARGFEDALEMGEPGCRIEFLLVPMGDVVVEVRSPAHFDVAGRIGAEIVGRIGEDEVDRGIGNLRDELGGVGGVNGNPAACVDLHTSLVKVSMTHVAQGCNDAL